MNIRLKVLMIEKGIKNFDLAKHLGVDPTKSSQIVHGWIDPDPVTRQKIAEFLEVDQEVIWQ